MAKNRIVYLFRSGDEPDQYEEALTEAGYTAISIPVLRFEIVRGEELRHALEHPRSYDGMILTSPRAVAALASSMPWLPTENILWHSKSIFAVGPRTASELRKIGFEATGEGSGSARMLAEHITTCEFEKPLLYLSGSRRRDDLSDALQQAGIDFEELCVYESKLLDSLEISHHPDPEWIVFFSPSGVEAVQADGRLDLSSVRIAAIGETTAESLPVGSVHAIAARPTPEALVQAITAADAMNAADA